MENISETLKNCISCNGKGKIECLCSENTNNNTECLMCMGIGSFSCPVCEGKGKY